MNSGGRRLNQPLGHSHVTHTLRNHKGSFNYSISFAENHMEQPSKHRLWQHNGLLEILCFEDQLLKDIQLLLLASLGLCAVHGLFIAVHGLSLVAMSGGLLSSCGARLLHSLVSLIAEQGFQGAHASVVVIRRLQNNGSVVVAHRIGCPMAYRILVP